ncbi:MAG: OmpA family protein [Hyphomicrobiales bacterium]
MFSQRSALGVLLITSVLVASNAVAQSACPEAKAQLAMTADDPFSTSTIFENEVRNNPACSDSFRTEMRKTLASLYRKSAQSAPASERVDYLEAALSYGRGWDDQRALGEALLEVQNYTRAAEHLQKAINGLNDNPTQGAINENEITELVEMAALAVGLADGPVTIPTGRNGNIGGVYAASVRGFKVKEVDVYITFEYDSDKFTPEGIQDADKLARAIVQQGPAEILLEGHTDPIGSDEYNMDLSLRRAEAMKVFLIERGYTGDVRVIPKGETEPPQLTVDLELEEEQIYRLARRVELIRP